MVDATSEALWFPTYVIAIALGFGIYITGVTSMARREATGGASLNLTSGLVVMIVGAAVLAFAPNAAENPAGWHVSPTRIFPVVIAMIALPVVRRGILAVRDPTPSKIQTTIRLGILTIIPLSAAFAVLGAGPIWGLVVISLWIPSIFLAMRFRVT